MSWADYSVFLVSQAFSEIGDHLWALGLRNYLFENSPWTPAAGLAALFIIQAIPVFLFGPWISQKIQQQWRRVAITADAGRLVVTAAFAIFLYFQGGFGETGDVVFVLLGAQFLLELGTIVFQNCRHCLIPVLYPNPDDISRAHLWANVASLSAAAIVPLLFLLALPAGSKIQLHWLMWAAVVDAFTFFASGAALFALRRSEKLKKLQNESSGSSAESSISPVRQFQIGLETARKYPVVVKILFFSFLYNLLLMGPVEIGLVTFLRKDLALPPASLAINLLLFVSGLFAGTFVANALWKTKNADHLKRFSHSIFWDGITFFPICAFALLQTVLPKDLFLSGLCILFFLHYTLVPFVKVSRLAAIQTLSESKHWSSLLGFHAVAVEGAAAISVVLVAFAFPETSGMLLLALGGLGATLCGMIGIFFLKPKLGSAESSGLNQLSESL
ncbi:MAG: Transrane secretion effector [Pseudomonadota bacterium]|jgi:hypothetical protein